MMSQPLKNRLLESLRSQTGEDLSPRFEAVSLPFSSMLFEEDVRPRFVHLITSGLTSIISSMSEGTAVEVGMTGSESFPEAAYLLGPQAAARKCVMQIGGTGLRMRFKQFEDLFFSNPALHRLVLRAVQSETFIAAQLVACNGIHEIEERLARWLLMVQDRIGDQELPLTQEYLAVMLGTRRSSVTLAAGNLQRAGLIEYRRGCIRIEDRERLEDASCECYRIVHKYFENLYR